MLVADMTERAVVVCVCVQGQGQVEQTQTSSSLTSSRLVAFAQPANPFRGLVVLVVDQLIVVHLFENLIAPGTRSRRNPHTCFMHEGLKRSPGPFLLIFSHVHRLPPYSHPCLSTFFATLLTMLE